MVRIEKDPVTDILNKGKAMLQIIKNFGFTIDDNVFGGSIYKDKIKVGRCSYFTTCDIHGPASLFMPVAEAIEKELGIEVMIYE